MEHVPIQRRVRLQIALLSKGLGSLERLARETGIERSRLSRISNEWINPRPDEARRIADALGQSPADLFGVADEEPQR
jgi:transcriptional regulator with XRE-family HTH domain